MAEISPSKSMNSEDGVLKSNKTRKRHTLEDIL